MKAAHVLNQRLFPTADRRFDMKVKCPTGRASFWVKFPTERSLTRVKCPGIAREGGGRAVLELTGTLHVGALQHGGSILRSQPWDNAHTLDLENCLLYLSSIISQFLGFIMHCVVLDFTFYCVTMPTGWPSIYFIAPHPLPSQVFRFSLASGSLAILFTRSTIFNHRIKKIRENWGLWTSLPSGPRVKNRASLLPICLIVQLPFVLCVYVEEDISSKKQRQVSARASHLQQW